MSYGLESNFSQYVMFFQIGLGCIPFLIVPEIVPTHQRNKLMSIAMFVNWGCTVFISLLVNQIVQTVYYGPFAGAMILAIIFLRLNSNALSNFDKIKEFRPVSELNDYMNDQ